MHSSLHNSFHACYSCECAQSSTISAKPPTTLCIIFVPQSIILRILNGDIAWKVLQCDLSKLQDISTELEDELTTSPHSNEFFKGISEFRFFSFLGSYPLSNDSGCALWLHIIISKAEVYLRALVWTTFTRGWVQCSFSECDNTDRSS